MASQQDLQTMINAIANDVNGFLGASVVDLDTGMTLAARSERGGFDLETASAYNSEMVKAKLKTINILDIQTELEDMLLTLGDQLHLIKMLDAQTFIYLAADRQATNLALVRSAVSRHAAQIK